MHATRILTILFLCFLWTGIPVPVHASCGVNSCHPIVHSSAPAIPAALPKPHAKSGILAYLSAGCGLIGLAIATPSMSLLLICLGTAAGVFGKMGLKAYRGRTFLRVLCIVGMILGAVVLALGMVPLIFYIH